MASSEELHSEWSDGESNGEAVSDESDFEPDVPAKKAKKPAAAAPKKTARKAKRSTPKRKAPADQDSDSDFLNVDEEKLPKKSAAKKTTKRPAAASGGAPAKKTKKVEVLSDDASTKCILEYMLKQNRPYSHQNVFDNLHGRVKKSMVSKILTSLAGSGDLQEKVYGKAKIYLVNQANFDEVDPAQLDAMDVEIKEATELINERKTALERKESRIARLKSMMTHAQLLQQLQAKRALAEERRKAVIALEEAGATILSADDLRASQDQLNKYLKHWKTRRQWVKDLVDTMIGDSSMKPDALMAKIGLETDKDLNVDLSEYLKMRT